jgi:acyl-CoA thioesterase
MSGRTPFSSYLDVFSKPRAAGRDSRDPSSSNVPGEVFTSQSLWVPCGARGVFGGQVIAQSLVAAGKTISSPLGLHSQHCYFVLPALASPPIEFHVERLRDGRSYATRLVRAVQRDKVIFVLIASYTLPPSAMPPLAQSGTPFSFTPMVDTASPEEAQTRRSTPVSHSLRFAVEQPTSGGDHPSQHRGWRGREGTSIPPFAPRFQIAFPEEVLVPEECEEEEDRWQRFLDEAGQNQTAKRKTSIEEYIQVRRCV